MENLLFDMLDNFAFHRTADHGNAELLEAEHERKVGKKSLELWSLKHSSLGEQTCSCT